MTDVIAFNRFRKDRVIVEHVQPVRFDETLDKLVNMVNQTNLAALNRVLKLSDTTHIKGVIMSKARYLGYVSILQGHIMYDPELGTYELWCASLETIRYELVDCHSEMQFVRRIPDYQAGKLLDMVA